MMYLAKGVAVQCNLIVFPQQ